MASITDKRKEVKNGIVYAELKKFCSGIAVEYGFSDLEIRRAPKQTAITIYSSKTKNTKNPRDFVIFAKQVQGLIQQRFNGWLGSNIDVAFAIVKSRGLDAQIQCQSLAYKLKEGLAVRRACYGVMRFIIESGANGCEIVVAGKLRGQRAKSMKFTQGKMIHSGQQAEMYVNESVSHLPMKQGVLGIKVKILHIE